MISLTRKRIFRNTGSSTQSAPPSAAAEPISSSRVAGGPTSWIEIAAAKIPPKIIWPSIPRFQKPMRKARLAPSPTRIRGAAWISTPRRFSAVSTAASSLASISGAMPATARIAVEMTSPRISEVPTNAACFHGDRSWRTSSVRRPRPRDAEGAGEVDGPACRKRSSMVDHSTADRLAIRGAPEFADNGAPAHHADAVRQAQDLIEVFADQDDGRTMFARRDQALMDGRAGARVKPAARAVRDHDLRRAAELPRDNQLLC